MERIHLQEQQYLAAERAVEMEELRHDPEYLLLDELDAVTFEQLGVR